ncbi:hypothetical protein Poli38472_000099 [Pythium oligandrum]|uniref:Uncharacterized protein n=1 Tax=Pythium oligandrum TaxID=41045 RepID=A0A8K1CD05_PYTOL|nr:hypothetical protein Poli38472_000099 [Pythium oligandrum]|eukprot:TMW60057.1 hypothetical protein Poli38472_000099 [Pythium oligandrum]
MDTIFLYPCEELFESHMTMLTAQCTIAVSEATLMDNMTSFLMEDPDTINLETNWWHPRVKVVEKWLREESHRAAIPEDGTEEMIRKHIQRGDIYAHIQLKCWKHILLELLDIPCFYPDNRDADGEMGQTSPSRGKLRPGKELIILSDDPSQPREPEPLLSDDGARSETPSEIVLSATGSPRRVMQTDANANSASTRKFANLSMMERQAEWLRKKQEKMEAEKQRQDAEKEKELTFQPKLMRRSTYSGDKPTKELEPQQHQPTTTSKPTRTEQPATKRPPSGNPASRGIPKATPKASSKKKKNIPTTQPIEISSNLLDSMRNELEASMSVSTTRLPELPSEPEEATDNNNNSSTTSLGPEATLTANANAPDPSQADLKAWSSTPFISGFRVDFDSSETKARLILQDASRFELSSMYRKTDRKAGRDGIALHMGRREDTFEEEVIAVLFDKEKVSEADAAKWWKDHEHRFSQYIRDRTSTGAANALASAVAALASDGLR